MLDNRNVQIAQGICLEGVKLGSFGADIVRSLGKMAFGILQTIPAYQTLQRTRRTEKEA